MPDVSVIIPTYSRPHLLPQAVSSAFNASRNLEVIVVDDASTDATSEVCRSLPGIRYIRLNDNLGVAGARRVGIEASRGRYLAFLDDDDLRLPESIEYQLETFRRNSDAAVVYSPKQIVDQNYQMLCDKHPLICPTGDLFWQLLGADFTIFLQGALIRKDVLLDVGFSPPHLHGIDDWDLMVRIAEKYPIIAYDHPVFIYRDPTPTSDQGTSNYPRIALLTARHQLTLFQLSRVQSAPGRQRRDARRRLIQQVTSYLLYEADRCLASHAPEMLIKNVLTALRLNPMRLARPGIFRLLLTGLCQRLANSFHKWGSVD